MPPVGTDCAVPVPPLHAALAVTVAPVSRFVDCVMVTLAVAVQPLASVTVTVYVPAESPVAVILFPPLGAHEY